MNTFLATMKSRGFGFCFEQFPFKKMLPINGTKVAEKLRSWIDANEQIFIDPDCDPDGYFSALIIKTALDSIGYKNYTVGRHDVKRHTIRITYIGYLMDRGFTKFIIVDSTSSDVPLMEYIGQRGGECIVIDHHICKYEFQDFPSCATVVNPRIDHQMKPVIYSELSAGAVCALVMDYFLASQYRKTNVLLYIYGFITLYSDFMNMSNPYNIAYIRRFQNMDTVICPLLEIFKTKYTHFDRSFVSFTLVPRINSLIRNEKFDMVHQLFYEFDSIEDPETFRNEIEAVYQESRAYVNQLISMCHVQQFEQFTVLTLPETVSSRARNFTGLVANHYASQLNQPVLCLFPESAQTWAGSVRDPFSRDMLSIFSSLCNADGHPPAFGVSMERHMLTNVINVLNSSEELFNGEQQNVILVNWDNRPYEDIKEEISTMVEYNELGGQGLPKAYAVLTLDSNFKIYSSEKYKTIYGKGLKLTCFQKIVATGDTVFIEPTMSGSDYQLLVNNVSLK